MASSLVSKSPELFPYQQEAVDKLKQNPRGLLWDEMGVGKTPTALCLMKELGIKKAVVVCPASVVPVWQMEVQVWYPELELEAVSYNKFARNWKTVMLAQPECLIVDEAHSIKNPKSQRTKAVLGACNCVPYAYFLTGTPMPNGHAEELWTMLSMVAPQEFSNVWSFYRNFTNKEIVHLPSQMGANGEKRRRTTNKWVGIKNYKKLKALLKPYFVRRLKVNVLDQLPPKRFMKIPLNVTPLNSHDTEDLVWEAEQMMAGAKESVPFAKMRREFGLEKVDAALDYLRDWLAGCDRKVVIFAHHKEVIARLTKGLEDYEPLVITGGTSEEERRFNVHTFQNQPERRVFIGNIIAAGTGITLTAASDVFFVEIDPVPGATLQASDRPHRVGQKESVTIHFMMIPKSLDCRMMELMQEKISRIERVLDE